MVDRAELIKALKRHLVANPKWKGAEHEFVLENAAEWYFSGNRTELQKVGENFGCHICGLKILENPENQVWIADHQPPVNLLPSVLEKYLGETKSAGPIGFQLFPQCVSCSKEQSILVRKLNAGALETLTADQLRLLEGHAKNAKRKRNYIGTTGTVANATERDLVQQAGVAFGCHTCPAKVPVTDYEADHIPPTTIHNYTWVIALCTKLGVALAANFRVRPACPSCQRAQGAKVQGLLMMAARFIYENDLPIPILTAGFAKHQVGAA